jgi:hypothetical protein
VKESTKAAYMMLGLLASVGILVEQINKSINDASPDELDHYADFKLVASCLRSESTDGKAAADRIAAALDLE